jgi:TonB family protein
MPGEAPEPREFSLRLPGQFERVAPLQSDREVAYTQAVRSAVAPQFFAAMSGLQATGTAIVEVVIGRSGSVRSTRMVRSSGDRALDAASLTAVQSASYPPIPEDVAGEELTIHIPLRAR